MAYFAGRSKPFNVKRVRDQSDDESAGTKKKQGREERVQEIVDALKGKHSARFTHMQMRIWAEMIQSGMYSSMDDPPSTSMFVRAGTDGPNRKKGQQNPVAQALSEAATALSAAFSPGNQRAGTESKCTGGLGIIESRSRLYKQLSELHELQNIGVLTEDEYQLEKDAIMKILKQLK